MRQKNLLRRGHSAQIAKPIRAGHAPQPQSGTIQQQTAAVRGGGGAAAAQNGLSKTTHGGRWTPMLDTTIPLCHNYVNATA